MMTQINLKPLLRMILATLAILSAVQTTYATTAPVTRNEIKQSIIHESKRIGLPPSLALAVSKVGSDFQPRTLSRSGARGVMQLYPQTVDGVTADDLWDPDTNIRSGVHYLNRLIQRYFGRWELALSHYHSGYPINAPLLTVIEPGSEPFVEQVLRWQERYKAQAEIWIDAPIYRDSVDTRAHKPTTYITASENDLDDFSSNIELRRLQARRSLDDFSDSWVPNLWRDGP
jgi:soluble lytic murein transglycosylase-like protein